MKIELMFLNLVRNGEAALGSNIPSYKFHQERVTLDG